MQEQLEADQQEMCARWANHDYRKQHGKVPVGLTAFLAAHPGSTVHSYVQARIWEQTRAPKWCGLVLRNKQHGSSLEMTTA